MTDDALRRAAEAAKEMLSFVKVDPDDLLALIDERDALRAGWQRAYQYANEVRGRTQREREKDDLEELVSVIWTEVERLRSEKAAARRRIEAAIAEAEKRAAKTPRGQIHSFSHRDGVVVGLRRALELLEGES